MTIDTSAEAVERLASALSLNPGTLHLRVEHADHFAATLRALAAERDALMADNHDLARQSEIAYSERDRLAAENARLREVLGPALELLDVCWGHDAGANLQCRFGPQPHKHAAAVRAAGRAALGDTP